MIRRAAEGHVCFLAGGPILRPPAVLTMATESQRLATIEADIRWIRETLKDADLVRRVGELEKAHARTQGAIAIAFSLITIGLAFAKAVGALH